MGEPELTEPELTGGDFVLTSTNTQTLKRSAASATDLATALAKDKKFRKEMLSAIRHGTIARRRAARQTGLLGAARRLSGDVLLRRDVERMVKNLERALTRVEKKRSNKLRNTLIIVGAGGAAAALVLPRPRRRLKTLVFGRKATLRTIDESIEVAVPVSTAYNQWTQFEDFPLFMEGIDHVQQIDDKRLHWAATIAGKQHEWDAKILEQQPDRQISWISEDGTRTRGTVTFEPQGEFRTLIRLSMSYQAEGPAEALGSAAGLDRSRVRRDLERFKELVEARGTETEAWRGEVPTGGRTD